MKWYEVDVTNVFLGIASIGAFVGCFMFNDDAVIVGVLMFSVIMLWKSIRGWVEL